LSKTSNTSPEPVEIDISEKPGFFRQWGALLVNEFNKTLREPMAFRVGLAQSVLFALIMGAIYFGLGHDENSIQNRAGALFFVVVNSLFGGLTGPFRNVLIEMRIFMYHNREGLYSTVPFVLAKFIVLVPEIIFCNAVYISIFYFMVKLQFVGTNIALFFMLVWVIGITTVSLGLFILYLFEDPAVAQTVFPMFFVPMMIFSGFYANSNAIPDYFIWAEYISLIKYGFNVAANVEFTGLVIKCSASELATYNGVCPYTKGEDWLSFRGLDKLNVWESVVILIFFMIFYLTLGTLILKGRMKGKKY